MNRFQHCHPRRPDDPCRVPNSKIFYGRRKHLPWRIHEVQTRCKQYRWSVTLLNREKSQLVANSMKLLQASMYKSVNTGLFFEWIVAMSIVKFVGTQSSKFPDLQIFFGDLVVNNLVHYLLTKRGPKIDVGCQTNLRFGFKELCVRKESWHYPFLRN